MQTMQKASMRTVAARPASARAAVVVRASADQSRRAVLGGLLAAAGVSLVKPALALTPLDVQDERTARSRGYDIIYEARDEALPQSKRDGLTQAREDLASTLKRVKESEARIDRALEPSIQKAYWTEAREELRRQVGTLRFDLSALAASKGKDGKKKAVALNKEFIASVEALDFALRSKAKAPALEKLGKTKAALDAVLAAVS